MVGIQKCFNCGKTLPACEFGFSTYKRKPLQVRDICPRCVKFYKEQGYTQREIDGAPSK